VSAAPDAGHRSHDHAPARVFYERQGARRTDDGLLQYGMDAAVMKRVVERG